MYRLDPPRRFLAATLAALAGYVDAVGYLSADRYFVSFMSGNTTRLGVDAITLGRPAMIPALLIAGFVFGAMLGTIIGFRTGHWRKPWVLGTVTALLAFGAAMAPLDHPAIMMAALVVAMGALNTALQRDDSPVALTYLTGTLVKIGQGLAGYVTGRRLEGFSSFIMMWLSLSCGAALGAAGYTYLGNSALLPAVAAGIVFTAAARQIVIRSA